MERSLERENMLVLDALQASLGLISTTMRAVSIQMDSDKVVLHFALREQTSDVDEDIQEIAFELDAALEGSTRIETSTYVGVPDKSWPGRAGRLLYLAKETSSGS